MTAIPLISAANLERRHHFEEKLTSFQNDAGKVLHLGTPSEVLKNIKASFHDDDFLKFLMQEHPLEIIQLLNTIVIAAGPTEYEIISFVTLHVDFPKFFEKHSKVMAQKLREQSQYFLDFQSNYDRLDPKSLDKMGIFFANAHCFDLVKHLLEKNCADLSAQCLQAILMSYPPETLDPNMVIEKIIPKIAEAKTFSAAKSLSHLAHVTRGISPQISEVIVNKWEQLTFFPMSGAKYSWEISSDLIENMSPEYIAQNLQSLIIRRDWDGAATFAEKGIPKLDSEALGILLMLAIGVDAERDSKPVMQHRDQNKLIEAILSSKQAEEIPKNYLRQALAGLSRWISINKKPTLEMRLVGWEPIDCTFVNKYFDLIEKWLKKSLKT